MIQHYAHAAFPIGGSECAQVSREALLAIAQRLANCSDAAIPLKPRQIPLLKAAIHWYFTEIKTDEALKIQLLQQLKSPQRRQNLH